MKGRVNPETSIKYTHADIHKYSYIHQCSDTCIDNGNNNNMGMHIKDMCPHIMFQALTGHRQRPADDR